MTDLASKLAKHHITISPDFDKGILREKNQWFIGRTLIVDGHELKLAAFGDWGRGIKERWEGGLNGSAESPEVRKQIEEMQEAARIEKERLWDEQSKSCQAEFETYSERGHSAYMARKQFAELFGARLRANEHGDPILVVPLRDVDGRLWNLQRIYSKRFEHGDKFFTEGARIDGCFHTLTSNDAPPTEIYICEGFATAASVAIALRGHASNPPVVRSVVSAFNAGNLLSVSVALRGKFKNARLIICADNDAYTVIDDRPYNVGIEKGRKAAGACKGELVFPTFKYPAKVNTDFNDLQCAEGSEKVLDQLLHPENYITGIQPMILDVNKNGATKSPTEKQVSDYLLGVFKSRIVRQEKSLFMYCGTHWVEQDSVGVDRVKQWIGVASQHTFDIKKINAAYQYFFVHCPAVPPGVNFFQPNPYAANFQNGTLHLSPEAKTLVFRPHDASDYLTNVLPFDCPALDQPPAPAPQFDSWLARMWAGDSDHKSKVTLYHQLAGACLCPAYPNITIFLGKPNRGKTTLVKMLVQLVSLANTSSVQLSDMHGFHMHSMVAKLVNFCPEMEINKPINDVMVKQLIDRMPFTVRRKFEADVKAFLPAVHLFASNDLPSSLDGRSKAYGRRLLIVPTESLELPGKAEYDFEKKLWAVEREGIIGRALVGLRSLVESGGRFETPESSVERVEEFETQSDILQQFFNEVQANDIHDKDGFLKIEPELRIQRSALWDKFASWQVSSLIQVNSRIASREFYRRMKAKFATVQSAQGIRSYEGLGWVHRSVETAGPGGTSTREAEDIG